MRFRVFLFCIFALLLFFSCSTLSKKKVLAGEGVVAPSSDIFIFVPTKHYKKLFSRLFPGSPYAEKILNRTEYLYLSLKLKDEASSEGLEEGGQLDATESSAYPALDEGDDASFENMKMNICAIGRYPKSMAGLVFNKKNGWQKEKSESGYSYYIRGDESAFSFFSIPKKELAIFSHNSDDRGEMETLLGRLESPGFIEFGEEFGSKIKSGSQNEEICVFVSNPHLFLSKLVGLQLDLPIESLKLYLKRNTESAKDVYNYSIILDMKNITAGFATRLLLSKLLKTQVRIEENRIIVEKAKIAGDRLLQIVKKVLPF